MTTDPHTLKPDSRSPRALAQAILDHPFTPESPAFAGVTFREQLEYNADDHYHQACAAALAADPSRCRPPPLALLPSAI